MTTPNDTLTATGDGPKEFISHTQMHEHREHGTATPLSRLIDDHVRFNGRWWIAERNGWHLITDEILTQMLDTQSIWVDGDVYLGGR